MVEIVSRLQALRPVVEKIRHISGATGVSVGIIHEAKVILTENFGYRDVEEKIPPDQDTIYYLASLSKSFTAAGTAHLIHRTPELTWDTPVARAYEPLSHRDPEIRKNASLLDFLSHRTGLAPKNHIWSQEYGHFTLRRGEDIRMVTRLEKIADFRTRWIYNNWGYAVADEMIEHLSGMSWGDYLKQHIFDPLDMQRTVTKKLDEDPNVAKAYIALSDGTPYLVEEPDGQDGEILEGALAVKSCVRDLLKYYIAFMKAVDEPHATQSKSSHSRPFIDAGRMVQPHVRLSTGSDDLDGSYGLGWVRVHLPCTLGAIGMNHAFVGRMPTVGRGLSKKTTCYYHQGSANSFLTSVHLLPDTQSGVVVLTNSMAQNDVADWLGELYLEAILDSPEPNNYVRLAENSAEAALALWPAMREELDKQQVPNTKVRPLSNYVGSYYNALGNYRLEILENNGTLFLRFQREKKYGYKMTHYHYDTFSWLISHDRDAKLGRFPVTRASFYLIEFDCHGPNKTQIDSLIWIHDDEYLKGERFFKADGQCANMIESKKMQYEKEPSKPSDAVVNRVAAELGLETETITDTQERRQEIAVVETELDDKSKGTPGSSSQAGNSKI